MAEEEKSLDELRAQLGKEDEGSKTADQGDGPAVRKGEDPLTSRGFSFARMANAIRNKDWSEAKPEQEMHEKLSDLGFNTEKGGHLVPFNIDGLAELYGKELGMSDKELREFMTGDYKVSRSFTQGKLNRAAISETDNGVGVLVEPGQSADMIDLLREAAILENVGARALDLPDSGQLNIPKQKSGATAYWVAENQTIPETDVEAGEILLRSKKLATLVKASNESLRHSTPSLEQMLREDLAEAMAKKQDVTFLYGSQKANADDAAASEIPDGLIELDGKYETSKDLTSPDDVIEIDAAMTDIAPTAMVMNKGERAQILKITDSAGGYVFLSSQYQPSMGNGALGIPFVVSEIVDDNHIFVGDYSEAIVARDLVMEIAASDSAGTAFEKDQTWFRAILGVDMGVRYDEAFLLNDRS